MSYPQGNRGTGSTQFPNSSLHGSLTLRLFAPYVWKGDAMKSFYASYLVCWMETSRLGNLCAPSDLTESLEQSRQNSIFIDL